MSFSNIVGKISRIREWYSNINPATLTGAIDVIVVEQPDGTFLSSPFHVRFGKYGVLRTKEKIVDIEVNNNPVAIHMKLDDNGAAYFVETIPFDGENDSPESDRDLMTSPIPTDYDDLPSTSGAKSLPATPSTEITALVEDIIERTLEETRPDAKHVKAEATGHTEATVQTDMDKEASEASDEDSDSSLPDVAALPSTPVVSTDTSSTTTATRGRKKQRRKRKDLPTRPSTIKEAEAPPADTSLVAESSASNLVSESVSSLDNKSDDLKVAAIVGDELDRVGVANQANADCGASFVLSRLPDQEKLDSILEHQAKLDSSSAGNNLTVDVPSTCHYFSEPEMTPITSPVGSRPPSPSQVLSDSELEVPQRPTLKSKEQQNWEWGKLPSASGPQSPRDGQAKIPSEQASPGVAGASAKGSSLDEDKQEAQAGWGLSYLWRGRPRREKSSGQNQDEETGIYLDDLKEDDSEKLHIYVGSHRHYRTSASRTASGSSMPPAGNNLFVDDDQESGKGPSLPISPRSVEGIAPNAGHHMEDPSHGLSRSFLPDVDISLCGGLDGDQSSAFSTLLFEQSKISFDDFVVRLKTPGMALFDSPDLVVRIGEQYFKWEAACPMLMSKILFGRSLPSDLVDVIRGSFQEPKSSSSSSLQKKQSTSWWPFSRTADSALAVTESASQEEVAADETSPAGQTISTSLPSSATSDTALAKTTTPSAAPVTSSPTSVVPSATTSTASSPMPTKTSPIMTPQPSEAASDIPPKPEESKEIVVTVQDVAEGELSPEMEATSSTAARFSVGTQTKRPNTINLAAASSAVEASEPKISPDPKIKEKYRKTLRLSNEGILRLNLLPGMNEVQFSVTTAFQGTTRCSCHLYLWRWSDKIVISDIDGTITKSDVLGHVLPVIGRDWAQSGVAELFTKIKGNGYHIAYLSARAIGQASFTKDYLASVRQNDLNLPDGPLLLNPTSLMNALHREVIEKKPEEFKIACLNDIRSLFPPEINPFFAGYGNRTNDVIAYTAVGIPPSRIFTINHLGQLKHESVNYQTSYSSQSNIVDHLFPPLNNTSVKLKVEASPTDQLQFSNFTFWREPMPAMVEVAPLPTTASSSESSTASRRRGLSVSSNPSIDSGIDSAGASTSQKST